MHPNSESTRTVRVLLDTGSGLSLVRRRSANLLQLAGGSKCTLDLNVAGGGRSGATFEREVVFKLRSLDGCYETEPMLGVTCKNPADPLPPVKVDPSKVPWLRNLKFTEDLPQSYPRQVDIILNTAFTLHLQTDVVSGADVKKPKCIVTKLGNALGGSYEHPEQLVQKPIMTVKKIEVTLDPSLQELVKQFSSLENMGISFKPESIYSKDDEEAVEMMKRLTTYDPETRHYETGLLWKKDPVACLDSNFSKAAATCAAFAAANLRRDPKLAELVNAAYREQLAGKFAERVPDKDLNPSHPVYYIPCHPVIRPGALSTKARIVFNASSKCKTTGYSLNDILHCGPNLIPDLLAMHFNFRMHANHVVLDVAKAFWQAGVRLPDADCLRYLWKFDADSKPDVFRNLCLTFGVISSPFQSIYIILDLAKRFEADFPRGSQAIQDSLYVDDVGAGADDPQELTAITREIIEVLHRGSMKPHKFNSNNKDILRNAGIPEAAWAAVERQKVLGVFWATKTDTIQYDLSDIHEDTPILTKRGVLQTMAKIFDPAGILTPFVLIAKLIFRETWLKELLWDENLPSDLATRFQDWYYHLGHEPISTPRQFATDGPLSLFVFCDASKEAYAAVAYVVSPTTSRILVSKGRTSPLKKSAKENLDAILSIARLELMALLVGCRLALYVKNSLSAIKFERVLLFSDSLITIYRVRNDPGIYKQFVANRLSEIRESFNPEQVRFVPGALNPADIASRGATMADLQSNTLWWSGPIFILRPESEWPITKSLTRAEAAAQQEEKELQPPLSAAVTRSRARRLQEKNNPTFLSTLPQRCSTWLKLVRVTAYLFRWAIKTSNKFRLTAAAWATALTYKAKPLNAKVFDNLPSYITVPEMHAAEFFWIRQIQRETFPDFADEAALKDHVLLKQVEAFLDPHGLIRTNTRASLCQEEPLDMRFPIFLPSTNVTVHKLVLYLHTAFGHLDKKSTLFTLRARFRLGGGRFALAKILSKCSKKGCNKPKPLQQIFAPLPDERLTNLQPWAHIAMDYFGPYLVRHTCDHDTCPHGNHKMFGLIFTCLQTRAVHLEIVDHMSTDTLTHALLRLFSTYGTPTTIFSDNALSYKAMDRTLKRALGKVDWQKLAEEDVCKSITWKWGIEKAPHVTGIVERLVGATKRSLASVLQRALLSPVVLRTTLAEVAAILNDRPLAPYGDLNESPYAVTPSMLVLGRKLRPIPFEVAQGRDPDTTTPALRVLAMRSRLMKRLEKVWRRDYLLELSVEKFQRARQELPLKPGQVVQLRRENLGKAKWTLARVQELHLGRDGLVRKVTLRTPTGIVNRHIKDIALLEGAPLLEDQI